MKRLLPFALVFGTLVAPAGAFASGVVLKVQPARHLVAVARTPSNVALIHTAAASRLHVGQRVDVKARSLGDGLRSPSGSRDGGSGASDGGDSDSGGAQPSTPDG